MSSNINEMEMADYSIVQNIKATFYRLWKLKLIPFFAAGIGILLAIAVLTYIGDKRSYRASATIYSAVYGSYSETVSGVTIMNTYSSILSTSRVCNRAAAAMNNSEISAEYLSNLVKAGSIYLSGASSQSRSYGYKLVLSVRMDTADYVAEIANAMASAFTSEINELLGSDVVQVFDEANYIQAYSQVPTLLVVVIAGAAGFVLACVVICIKEFFSSRVFIVSQCIEDKDKILGIIPLNR